MAFCIRMWPNMEENFKKEALILQLICYSLAITSPQSMSSYISSKHWCGHGDRQSPISRSSRSIRLWCHKISISCSGVATCWVYTWMFGEQLSIVSRAVSAVTSVTRCKFSHLNLKIKTGESSQSLNKYLVSISVRRHVLPHDFYLF